MALIIFSFLPETPKSSLYVTFGYMTILNFQYNQLDMLYFSLLLHHRRVGVKVINRTHRIRYSILFTFNALVRISHLMRDHESEQVRVNAADEIQLIGGAIVPSIRC